MEAPPAFIGFDCETRLIQPGVPAPPLVAAGFSRGVGSTQILLKQGALEFFRHVLQDTSDVLVAHHAAFDVAVFCANDPSLYPLVFKAYDANRIRCTMTNQELLDVAAGRNGSMVWRNEAWEPVTYSLVGLEKLYLGIDRTEEKNSGVRTNFITLEDIPVEQWPLLPKTYLQNDCESVLQILEKQGYDIPNQFEQYRAAFALHLTSCQGLRTDPKAVEALGLKYREEYLKLQKRFLEKGFYKIVRPTSDQKPDFFISAHEFEFYRRVWGLSKPRVLPASIGLRYAKDQIAIRAAVVEAFKKLGTDAPITDKNQIKIDADTLDLTDDPILQELGGSGPVGTIVKTFLPTLELGTKTAINPRIRTVLNTGRPSCSEPNLYNLPREGGVRECFIPQGGGYEEVAVPDDYVLKVGETWSS